MILVLIFILKDIKMITVWLLQELLPNKDVFLSLYNMMYVPGKFCRTTISELNDILDTHFFFNLIAPRGNLKTAVGHIAISIKVRLIVQPYFIPCKLYP